ncbi:MAG: DUF6308 family protein [Isosphaeraceae bacterium]|nr:DUF6308 family protein [Isosphaeraceae bacterium]
MRLRTGLEISNPRKVLRAFVKQWYPMYDGVLVFQDNQLLVTDIALSTMMNARLGGTTGAFVYRARGPIESGLAKVPAGLDLLDVVAGDDIPGAAGISEAIAGMASVPRVKLSAATKILHKKRPGLIPILDTVVEAHYFPKWCQPTPGRGWGDYGVSLIRVFHQDMLSVAVELRDLEYELEDAGTPLTPCRILNVLMWIAGVGSGYEEWIVQEATS